MPDWPLPFHLTNPRQQRVHRRLRQLLGQGPAAFFLDACKLADAPAQLLSTSHLMGHLCRDIESALRDVLVPPGAVPQRKARTKDTHRREVRACLEDLDIPSTSQVAIAWLAFTDGEVRLAGLAHRDSLNPPRPIERIKETWERFQQILDDVLERAEHRYLEWHRRADALARKDQPSGADIQRIKETLPNNAAIRGYLFNQISSWHWLDRLAKAGFFDHPPAPEVDPERNSTRFPPWPESRLLARMAKDERARTCVLRIAQSIPSTENIWVQEDLVDVALALPASDARALVPRLKAQALTSFPTLIHEKLGSLVVHLARGELVDDALDFAAALLDVRSAPAGRLRDVVSHMDDYEFGQVLAMAATALVEADPDRGLSFLLDLLERALRAAADIDDRTKPIFDDHSWGWRPAIEEHAQNGSGHDIRQCIVGACRDAATTVARGGPDKLGQVVADLERRGLTIHRRLALHVLRSESSARLDLVEARLTTKSLFDDPRVRHEYFLLVSDSFERISESGQQTYLQWIEQGPSREYLTRRDGSPLSAEALALTSKCWKRDRLSLIEDCLPAAWVIQYAALIAEVGAAAHPEFPSYWSAGRGARSPRTAEELASMTVEELASFLRTWEPTSPPWDSPTRYGLGLSLTATAKTDARRLSSAAALFTGLDPTFVRSLLDGLRQAVVAGQSIEWKEVLVLSRWAVEQPRTIPRRVGGLGDQDPDWSWCRMSVLGLIRAGFKSASSIPFELRHDAWAAIHPLTDDPDPEPSKELCTSADYLNRAINTIRGEALSTSIDYAWWVQRDSARETAMTGKSIGLDTIPEVRAVLDAHLDPTRDPAPETRAIYGMSIPILGAIDLDWLRESVVRILPACQTADSLRAAAWAAYVLYARVTRETFDLLTEHYAQAIRQLREAPVETDQRDPAEGLVVHLMSALMSDWVDLDSPDGLVRTFFETAPGRLRVHAIEVTGRSLLYERQPLSAEVRERLQRLWDTRLDIATLDPAAYRDELKAFGWWFASGTFDAASSLARLRRSLELGASSEPAHAVLEQLGKTTADHGLESLTCVRLMLDNDLTDERIWTWQRDARVIVEKALRSTIPAVINLATVVVNKLASRGQIELSTALHGRQTSDRQGGSDGSVG